MAVAEFSIYPFVTDRLEPYVTAALEETRRSGLTVDVGPLGTTVQGDHPDRFADALVEVGPPFAHFR